MRKGQLLGQIVVFVIGLIVVAAVLYFGYAVLQNMNVKRCEVLRAQFGTNLEQAIQTNRQWGTRNSVTLSAPCQSTAVCFIDRPSIDKWATNGHANGAAYQPFTFISKDAVLPTPAQNATMQTSVQSFDPTNVFTIQQDGTVLPVSKFSDTSAAIAVSNPNQDGKAVCYQETGGQFHVTMIGTGALVQVGAQ